MQDKYSNLLSRPKNDESTTEISHDDYEKLEKVLQKYEKDVRQHISLEQQLKLYLDNL